MIEIMHRGRNHAAFLYEGQLTGKILSKQARLLDGNQPEPRTQIVCGSCGERLQVADLEEGKESELAFFAAAEH